MAEFHLSATEEIKSWLLGFGSNAHVLEPDRLRREIVRELEKSLDQYRIERSKRRPRQGEMLGGNYPPPRQR
jgi:WYL domain-containing protein